jgi:hypothetical protein
MKIVSKKELERKLATLPTQFQGEKGREVIAD